MQSLGSFPLIATPNQTGPFGVGTYPWTIPLSLAVEAPPNPSFPNLLPNLLNAPAIVQPYTIGQNGYVEVINYSPFLINVNLGGGNGTADQEPYSKVLYLSQKQSMGQLALTITPLRSLLTYNQASLLVASPYLILNTYQSDETQPYAPIALTPPPLQPPCPLFFFGAFNAAATMTLPGGGTYIPGVSDTFLLGFDLTLGTASAAAEADMVINNVSIQNSNSFGPLKYRLKVNSSTPAPPLSIRFPGPLGNTPGSPITFSLPLLSNGTIDLIAYFLQ